MTFCKEIFTKVKTLYEKALKNSGFKTSLSYIKDNFKEKRLREKKVFYYNQPFRNCVKTNIKKEFPKVVSKYFPKSGIYGKIFNKNTIKISYSCMLN